LFALAATQAVLDRVGNPSDLRLLEDQALGAEQAEAWSVGSGQIGAGEQFRPVEVSARVDLLLVRDERGDLVRRQVFELGDPYAVLARDDAAQGTRQRHDAAHR